MLRRIAFLLLLGSTSFAQTSPAIQKTQPSAPNMTAGWHRLVGDYGTWWNSLSEDAKNAFLDGYLSGMERAHSLLAGFANKKKDELVPGDPAFNAKMDEAMLLSSLANEFRFDPKDSLISALDSFYRDPLNGRITLSLAIGHVRDEVEQRKTAGELLDELNDWRKIVNSK